MNPCIVARRLYLRWVRHLLALSASAVTLLLGGCAQDTPPAEEVREHFQRGLSGEGQLGPIDRGDDPYVNPEGMGPNPH
jgi:hypothetical protein